MYLRKLSIWSALGMAVLVACGQQEPSAQKEALPLAQVGEELITDRDIRYLIDNVAEWAKSDQEGGAKVREYLQSLIDRTLILREARAGKLDRSPAFVSEVATALRRRLIREIEQRAVDNQVDITEEEMRRVFAEQNWERWIKIAHIVVPTQERAEEAMAALRAGTPFEEVAREFSTHSRTASLGGVKPMYYSRFHAVPLVRDVLFSLKVGEISEPIAVPQGYEIFKVLSELQGTYEQTRDFLFKTLSEERLDARRKAYADSLAEQFQLTPDPHGLGVLMGILRGGGEEPETGKKTFQIPEGAAETPLFRYAGGQISLGEAILQSPFIRQGRNVSDSVRVAHFLERDVVIPQLMWMEADKLELDRELEEWVKRKEEEVLIVTMRRIATSTEEEISEQEVLDYYEETKDQYRTASEVNVVEIQLASEGEAEALLAEIRGIFRRAPPLIDLLTKMKQKQQAGRDLTEEVRALRKMDDDLEVLEWLRQRLDERGGVETVLEEIATASSPKELAEEYIMRQLASTRSLRPGASETEGHYHLYWYETARFGDLVTAAFEGEIGSLIGPIQVGPSYSVAKILSRRESAARPYEERERQIRANIRKERERELFGNWLKDLRTSYEDEVRYFDDNIEKLGRELTAEGRG
ncbi:MAG: peptidyl-prolyl cis-trans isomerase [Gemmatimonadota bacterium]|nr:peptidyl-prolyl cis-trans isomerase [Gemmatimonadota bacterium]